MERKRWRERDGEIEVERKTGGEKDKWKVREVERKKGGEREVEGEREKAECRLPRL